MDGLSLWTHRPVHPAEVFSPLLLQSRTTRCCFLPWQGKGAESSFLCPLPSRSVSEIGVSNLLFPSRKQSPPSPSHRTELGEGLAAFLSTTCPSSSSSCWDPWTYPPYYIALVSVCVRACACVALEGAGVHRVIEGGYSCVCGGVVLLFGATLVDSAPGSVLSAPPPPCSVPQAALHPQACGQSCSGGQGAEGGGRGDPPALGSPPVRPSEGPWVDSSERVKDAQGNTGLSCL